MEWRGREGSRNIEDRRGMGVTGAGGLGIVGTLVVLAVGYFFGVDITPLVGGAQQQTTVNRPLDQQDQTAGQFVSVVLGSTEQVWSRVLPQQANVQYAEPQLVLYSGVTQSGCGGAQAAMGPFYCPQDRKVYLDTDFFGQMQNRMGAGGDFAYSYVIAHEIGHHVQNLLGILPKVTQMRQRASKADSNNLSVLTELQADCFAGIWGRQAQQSLKIDRSDFNEAIRAAEAVGDDTLQQSAGRVPMPDSFTHGSAQDRMDWFARGFNSGELSQCNTFAAAGL